MSILYLTEQLNNIENPTRENRKRVSNIVIENRILFKDLVFITFDIDSITSNKAAWILEWICNQHQLNWILPHLDIFQVKFDSKI
ncbi:hypothetical protein [Polaribacter glomeratus]|uniref:Uncharacterized protein n=1 Tax=Polaribacter glomeratus TaxID=102 RepID=A0A2S7WVF1_9FLAO|nr:hypothetical protein [Polaribacter glomeratus]PQJ81573.1 hypothetical protein BTO16_02870 [Polaribacter glomeratus]TXD64597.1 hypothetical protein ESX12_13705 [Polaribacter glomeratus]